eukprot:15616014-Heterocapsa_arctica.AAC.1
MHCAQEARSTCPACPGALDAPRGSLTLHEATARRPPKGPPSSGLVVPPEPMTATLTMGPPSGGT